MRNREYHGFEKGTQNQNKLIIIEFIGWQIVKQTRSRLTYNPASVKMNIDKHMLAEGTELILWYDLAGRNKPVYNKFPVSPSKKMKETEGKLSIQLMNYADITHLIPGKFYAIWETNTDEKTHGTDKPGYWYWTDIMELTSRSTALEIVSFKTSIRFEDKDHPHTKDLIKYIDYLGKIDGPALYDYIMRKSEGETPKAYDEILSLIDYVSETEVITPRLKRFLNLLNKQGLLDKYLN